MGNVNIIFQKRDVVAIVDYWPGVENAETEVILRIRRSLDALNVGMVTIDRHGCLIDDEATHVDDLDYVKFVIALHFDTASAWNKYTYFALWNPIDFYFQWGYREKSNNIVSADDFLSCGSTIVEDHVKRLLNGVFRKSREKFLTLYHGVPGPMLPPGTGRKKLFYCGINWEALSGRGGRHHEVLKLLEKKGLLDIYGPDVFQGVRVWAGYEAYRGPIPFDGKTLVEQVAKSGIGLVLASAEHIKSEIMSNRLFECISAGVPIICDMHPFAINNFGDTLLYVDSELSPESVAGQVETHVNWILQNPDGALDMVSKAQEIYLKNFSLEKNLQNLLTEFRDISKEIEESDTPIYSSIFLAENCGSDFLTKFRRYAAQTITVKNAQAFVLIDENVSDERLSQLFHIDCNVSVARYREEKNNPSVTHRNLVNSLESILNQVAPESWVNFVLPWEMPCWSRIVDILKQIDHDQTLNFVETGFCTLQGGETKGQLKSSFTPVVSIKNIFDANSPYSCASLIFRRNAFDNSIFSLLRHSKFFWYRFLYIYLKTNRKGCSIGAMTCAVDFDLYSNKYRVQDIQEVVREVEFANDYLGSEASSRFIGFDVKSAAVDVDAVINEIRGEKARFLLGRLLLQLKLPSFLKKIGEYMWNRGGI